MRSKWFFFKSHFFGIFLFVLHVFTGKRSSIKKKYVTVSATQFPTKWCPFQPLRSKTVGGETFLVAESVLFQEGRKTHQNITKSNYAKNINVSNNINCWYEVLILLHWWNNNFKKWFGQKNLLYGTVRPKILVSVLFLWFFLFFWTDNALCPPPLSPPMCKTFNIYRKNKSLNENYVEFYFSMGIVLVIF